MTRILVYLIIIGSFLLVLITLFRNGRRKKLNQYFAALALTNSFWAIANLMSSYQPLAIWVRLQYAFGALLMGTGLVWFFYLLSNRDSKKRNIIIAIPSLFFFIGSLLPNLIIQEINQVNFGSFEGTFGVLFYVYTAYIAGSLFFMDFRLLSGAKKSTGIKRDQLLYSGIGALLFTILAVIPSFILPIIKIPYLSGLDLLGSFIFLTFTAYAIVRHRLLDIRLVVTRSLVYGLLLTLVTFLFVFITFLSAQFFSYTQSSRNLIAFIVAILIVFGLDPLKNLLSRLTDKVFFKAKVNYQFLLREVSEILGFEINRDELIRKIRTKLQEGLKVKFAATLLRKQVDGHTDKFEALYDLLSQNPNLSVRNDSPLIQFLREHRHYSIVESLERKIDDTPEEKRGLLIDSKKEFDRLGASLVTPIFAQGHLIAVLALGPKLSGDSFSNDDIQLIEVLSPQIGSAIQKANLFEEVRQFSESLKIKVAEATSELQERNVSLQTLQHITQEITRTLDFNKVVQQIADSVSTELGYIGAILAFLDDEGKTSRARAITQTALTQRALKLLPKHFSEYTTDITDKRQFNLATEVYRTGVLRIASSFSEVVSPPLPRLLANTIQKLIGVKSVVLVPVSSEGKTIGVMEIGVKKVVNDISKQELDTMRAVADELGVVSRNLKLFEQIQKTNAQLEVANAHLKELDRAKSEFVSIASHQLRTPMTGIMGYLSMMTQGDFGKIKPEHATILSNLLAESQRMIRLINQFLNVSKIEAGKFTYTKKPVQLIDLVTQEVNELNKAIADKGLKLETKLPKTMLPVTADGDKLQDVILNLIDNAIKYTAQGKITVGAETLDDQVHFWVKDSGIGIKKQDASELFNKFVRGSGIAQIHPDGSGLGLFIAKSIIDAHGGRIWAQSDGEGKGSTFQFVIPINPSGEATSEQSFNAAAHVVSTKRT